MKPAAGILLVQCRVGINGEYFEDSCEGISHKNVFGTSHEMLVNVEICYPKNSQRNRWKFCFQNSRNMLILKSSSCMFLRYVNTNF